jgi:SAM-dependent methyltransferase
MIRSALSPFFRAMPTPFKSALLGALNSAVGLKRGVRPRLRRLGVSAVSYVGSLRCSVCGKRVWRFDPLHPMYLDELSKYGFRYTTDEAETCNAESYSCPHCEAADRERLYALYLREYFDALAPGGDVKMIDFAPSPPLSRFIRRLVADSGRGVSYVTADLFMEGVDDRVDISDMKAYADRSVDFFICSHVLEHVPDDREALAELYRILKQGGRGILVVPIVLTADEIDEDPSVTDPAERWRRFGQDDHVRLYSKGGFLSRVCEAGFAVRQLGQGYFGSETFRRHGITDRSVLYIVEKNG